MFKNCLVVVLKENREPAAHTLNGFISRLQQKQNQVEYLELFFQDYDWYLKSCTASQIKRLIEKVYLLCHGGNWARPFFDLLIRRLAMDYTLKQGVTFTLISCDGAAIKPLVDSQNRIAVSAAVDLLNAAIQCGVENPLVYAYSGVIGIVSSPSIQLSGAKLEKGKRYIFFTKEELQEIRQRPDFISCFAHHLTLIHPILKEPHLLFLMPPRYMPHSKSVYFYEPDGRLALLPAYLNY